MNQKINFFDYRKIKIILALTAVFCWLFLNADGLHAQAGSNCQNAIIITPGTYTVDTIVDPSPIFASATKAKWYKYTPTTDGLMTIGSCLQGKDTRLAIAIGRCDSLTIAGFSDDDCAERAGSPDSLASYLTKFVRANVPYYIIWDNAYDSSRFQFTLTFNNTFVPRAGESCGMAKTITIPAGNTFTTTLRVDSITGIPTRIDASKAIWYKFTAPRAGRISISTCGEGEDTRLFLYRGVCATLQNVAESDDVCAMGTLPFNWAAALTNIPVVAATTYYFEFDDLGTDGFYNFTFAFEAANGVEEDNNLKNRLKIYPNPAHDLLTVATNFEKNTDLTFQLLNSD
jgi:hypothetical protein